jgi:hypothetical protein
MLAVTPLRQSTTFPLVIVLILVFGIRQRRMPVRRRTQI